jgi:hypothetical protein
MLIFLTLISCSEVSYNINGIKIHVDSKIKLSQEAASGVIEYAFSDPAWRNLFINYKQEFPEGLDHTNGNCRDFFMRLFNGWNFVFTDNWIKLPSGELVDSISFIESKKIVLKVNRCEDYRSIIHEIGHTIRNYWEIGQDKRHKDYEFWIIVRWMGNQLVDNLCATTRQIISD